MQKACEVTGRNALVFFDEGHGEYRKLYRKGRVYLPTGSAYGTWGAGDSTRNLPLSSFTKDANFKDSKHSWFVQIADLVSYAVHMKIGGEDGTLAQWQKENGLADVYSALPRTVLNL